MLALKCAFAPDTPPPAKHAILTLPRGEEPEVKGDDPRQGRRVHGARREAQDTPEPERRRASQEALGHGRKRQGSSRQWQGRGVRRRPAYPMPVYTNAAPATTTKNKTPTRRSSAARSPAPSSPRRPTSGGKTSPASSRQRSPSRKPSYYPSSSHISSLASGNPGKAYYSTAHRAPVRVTSRKPLRPRRTAPSSACRVRIWSASGWENQNGTASTWFALPTAN